MAKKNTGAYERIIEKIFFEHFEDGESEFEFIRRESEETWADLGSN